MTSIIVSADPQRDGRLKVHELHAFDRSAYTHIWYMAEVTDDLEVNLAIHASIYQAQIESGEVDTCIDQLKDPVIATRLDFLTRLVKAYLNSTGLETGRLATYLQTLNPTELTEFSLNLAKLQSEATLYNTVIALRGG